MGFKNLDSNLKKEYAVALKDEKFKNLINNLKIKESINNFHIMVYYYGYLFLVQIAMKMCAIFSSLTKNIHFYLI